MRAGHLIGSEMDEYLVGQAEPDNHYPKFAAPPCPKSPLEIAKSHIQRGWTPIPIPYRSKKPVLKGWQLLNVNAANVHQHFGSDPQNSGLLLGPRSGGLTDIDLDCQEAIVIAPFILPKTAAIFGRPSARASHYLYYTTLANSVAKSKIAFQDPISRTTLLEIRIGGETGAQTIGPGSTHEIGEPIDWEDNGDPTRVDDGELIRCVRLAAVASLFARYYPQEGARHDAALALGGFLSRAGLAPSWVRCVVEGIARAARDAEFVNRRETAFDAATAFHAGKNAFGIPGLSKFFEQRIVSQAAEWLDYPSSRDEQTKLEEGTPAIVWRKPSELPASLRPVAPFDFHFLPETIVPWVRDISDRMQCPADFVAVSAITALGAALGRKIGVRPQRQTDWFEVPNFWACIVGRPGTMKSPAMVEALRPLSLLEAETHAAN